jgi:hypothetical protein
MSKHFFIVGPARCRTAWLAAFLSYAGVHCHHEAVRLCEDGEGFKLLMEGAGVVGDSDSGVCLNVDWFLREYPDARYLIVDRPFSHVVESVEKHFHVKIPASSWEKVFTIYSEAREKLRANARYVLFDDLHERHVVKGIWDYCTFDAPWDEAHYDLFKDLVIQVPKSYDLTYQSGFMRELIAQRG